MDAKKEYIADLAKQLMARKQKMTGAALAVDLNNKGHLTYSNDTYVVGGVVVFTPSLKQLITV
ncbi:hypothetical protein [Pedobacter sp. FW305-3-2-15-E-R2A2]|uniref:hypothetical protein n=1 Tax=Pedobacter sp. FW305-3-2-15-E-R2A2 TaxID=3140251 RepID=UPI0031402203